MSAEEMEDWLVGVVAVKMGIPPHEVRSWPIKDTLLAYNTIAFLNELEQREIEKAKKEVKLQRGRL